MATTPTEPTLCTCTTCSLTRQLQDIDRIQARRFGRLSDPALSIATTGILRHLTACKNIGVEPDVSAIREIIDDAQDGRAVYAETGWEPRRGVQTR